MQKTTTIYEAKKKECNFKCMHNIGLLYIEIGIGTTASKTKKPKNHDQTYNITLPSPYNNIIEECG